MHATKKARRASSDPADALQRIDEVLRLSRSAIWEVDRDGVFTYVSASFEDLLGYRPDELVGRRTIHDFYAKDLPPELEQELSEDWIGLGEEFSQLAIPLVSKSGETIWVSSSGMPIRDAEGRVIGFRGADRDITALKRAEEQLRASERTLWRQMEEAPVPMAFTTLSNAGELHVNRAFVRIFGYTPEEIPTIEAWFARAYPDPAYRDRVQRDTQEWMEQAARGEILPPREYRLTCRDGRLLDVEIAAAVVAGRLVGTFTDVTMRRRELELRKAREEELRRVLDNLPFPVATTVAGKDFDWQDPRAEVTYLNRRFTELFGFTRVDIPTVSMWARLAFPDEKKRREVFAALEQQLQEALRGTGGVGPVELQVASKDGTTRDVLVQAVAVDSQLVVSLEDITERNRARAKLAESEERFRKMIEQAPVAIAYTDPVTGVVWMNAAHEALLGYRSSEQWTRERLAEQVFGASPTDLREWDECKREARQRSENLRRELRVVARDGSEREVELTSIFLPGVDFNLMIDLTERNRVLRDLRGQEELLRSLVEYAPVPIAFTLPGEARLHMNRAFTEAYGWTGTDIPTAEVWFVRAYPNDGYRREVLARWDFLVERARRMDGRVPPAEYRVTAKNGSEHDVEISAVVHGEAIFGTFLDLTDRNRAERLLRERQEQLARVGRVSTLGQLAASLAHELDQPLGAILNNAEAARLMLSGNSPDLTELRAIVDDILADDRRAGAVLDRIRGMVRQRTFESQAVPVDELLLEVVRLIRPLTASRHIALQVSCESGTPSIEGDMVLLQQALLNLAVNAVDAIGDRTNGRIEIRAGEVRAGLVEIGLSDNGGGVPPAEYASLFEPFYTTKRDGLGMGLPLVRSIAEQHGGDLRLDNQPGRGLAVYLQLPARQP